MKTTVSDSSVTN